MIGLIEKLQIGRAASLHYSALSTIYCGSIHSQTLPVSLFIKTTRSSTKYIGRIKPPEVVVINMRRRPFVEDIPLVQTPPCPRLVLKLPSKNK